jgi:hypothetical protein
MLATRYPSFPNEGVEGKAFATLQKIPMTEIAMWVKLTTLRWGYKEKVPISVVQRIELLRPEPLVLRNEAYD